MIFNLFWRDESGTTMVGYGLIAALVSVAIIAALVSLGDSLNAVFDLVNDALQDAPGGVQST